MSPSNPATLRETLRWYAGEIDSLPCEDVEHADDGNAWNSNKDVPSIPNIIFDQGKRAKAALAASGTEAGPPVTCESCKSTNTHRYENAGGLKMYSCADCEWHHFVPAQAAASPEGEGREAACFAIAALEPERLKSTEYKTGFIDAKNFALELVQRQSAWRTVMSGSFNMNERETEIAMLIIGVWRGQHPIQCLCVACILFGRLKAEWMADNHAIAKPDETPLVRPGKTGAVTERRDGK